MVRMKRSHFSASTTGLLLLLLLLVVATSQLPGAESVTCNPYQLLPCSGSFSSGKPSPQCCAKVREQQPCFCQYLRDPNLRKYVNSPTIRRIGAACRVPYPHC